jgi:UDP-N-acetylmuramoylalanine--D-glutamate ligase
MTYNKPEETVFKRFRFSVLGMAKSGLAAALAIQQNGGRVFASEVKSAPAVEPALEALARQGIPFETGGHTDRVLDAEVLVVSPGIPLNIPILLRAREKGLALWSEVELACQATPEKLIGITGSNGKSTTTAWTAHLLQTAGARAQACGNIGTPMIECRESFAGQGYLVVELSSFQLEITSHFHPRAAAILNISPNHLDRYKSIDDYYNAKKHLAGMVTPHTALVINFDDNRLAVLAAEMAGRCRVAGFSVRGETPADGAYRKDGRLWLKQGGTSEPFLEVRELSLPGSHNIQNALAAVLIVNGCGFPPAACREGLKNFPGLSHRLERVRELEGVTYYNDSKATTVASMEVAIRSFTAPVVLLAGGRDKNADFGALTDTVKGRVKHLVLFGEARDKIHESLGDLAPSVRCRTLEEAILAARQVAAPGEIVLLSPGCASYDAFHNFEERGAAFKKAVLALPEVAHAG